MSTSPRNTSIQPSGLHLSNIQGVPIDDVSSPGPNGDHIFPPRLITAPIPHALLQSVATHPLFPVAEASPSSDSGDMSHSLSSPVPTRIKFLYQALNRCKAKDRTSEAEFRRRLAEEIAKVDNECKEEYDTKIQTIQDDFLQGLYRGLTHNMETGNLPGHPTSPFPELQDKIMEQRLELSCKDQLIQDMRLREEHLQGALQEATRRVADAEQRGRDKLAQVQSVIARLFSSESSISLDARNAKKNSSEKPVN
ncbi:hypothetical protein ARMGADRAFT_1031915 [Armillaria gallica]|uniref:Uncharacterized protein n=1 Tax=Armillaria gallica TaxID=47427 RepID=A0A2H3DSJ7_ARMGA|nr:hypothetical protein ARMGADRAFT_1031915 [Armillaria gallica]